VHLMCRQSDGVCADWYAPIPAWRAGTGPTGHDWRYPSCAREATASMTATLRRRTGGTRAPHEQRQLDRLPVRLSPGRPVGAQRGGHCALGHARGSWTTGAGHRLTDTGGAPVTSPRDDAFGVLYKSGHHTNCPCLSPHLLPRGPAPRAVVGARPLAPLSESGPPTAQDPSP